AQVVAPCPHDLPCRLEGSDWCHFSRRVARSRLHRLTKDADVPWEDEKFAYLAVSRHSRDATRNPRVLAPPRAGSGKVSLKLCQPDGRAAEQLFTKRNGEGYKIARRAGWGDSLQLDADLCSGYVHGIEYVSWGVNRNRTRRIMSCGRRGSPVNRGKDRHPVSCCCR